jgi:hypothetical protein
MNSVTLGLRRVFLCRKDVLRSSPAFQLKKFSVATAPREGNDQNPTPNPDIYPPNPDIDDFSRRDPDLYPSPPSRSPPGPGPSDLPMPDTDPIQRDINPDINPSDMPGM